MRSSWSIGLLMGGMGIVGVMPQPGRAPASTAAFCIAALLIAGGVLLALRNRRAFQVALTAGAVTATSGVLAMFGHSRLAMPLPPLVSLVVGLYLCFRILVMPSSRPTWSVS